MSAFGVVSLFVSFFYVVGLLAMMYQHRGELHTLDTRLWMAANAAALFAFVALLLDQQQFGVGIVLLRNLWLVTAAVLVIYALLRVACCRPNIWLLGFTATLFLAEIAYYTLVEYNEIRRFLAFDLFAVFFSVYSIVQLVAAHWRKMNRNYLMLVGAFGAIIVVCSCRTFFVLRAGDFDLAEIRHPMILVGLLVSTGFLFLWNIVYYLLVSQET